MANDRKYLDAVYAAVSKHELGDTLTRRQIEAVLDTAGRFVVGVEVAHLADGLCCGHVLWSRVDEIDSGAPLQAEVSDGV